MRIHWARLGLLVVTLALGLGAAPAAAEMFTCHDKPGQLLYSYNGTAGDYRGRNHSSYSRSRYSDDQSARTRYYRAGAAHATYFRSRHYWNDR